MKIIEKPSPNYNNRPKDSDIDCIVIHHTGGGTLAGAISWFQDKTSNVSAHYILDTNGDVYRCVQEDKRAWHCGESKFKGVEDVNDFSVGIELLGDGSFYPTKQLKSLVELTASIMSRHKYITMDRITGHENIALKSDGKLGRKSDPGVTFPWAEFRADVRSRLGEMGL